MLSKIVGIGTREPREARGIRQLKSNKWHRILRTPCVPRPELQNKPPSHFRPIYVGELLSGRGCGKVPAQGKVQINSILQALVAQRDHGTTGIYCSALGFQNFKDADDALGVIA
ncbi:MAG: hypothetical protein ACI9R3_003277 [Verrucomicrobiales bacterium]|jgi:hypothetical protein